MPTPNDVEEQGFSNIPHWAEVEGVTPERYRQGMGNEPPKTPPPPPPKVEPPPAAPTEPQIEVGIDRTDFTTRETVNEREFKELSKREPILADVLLRQGYKAYVEADEGFRRQSTQRETAAEVGVAISRYDVSKAQQRATETAEAKESELRTWTAAELQNGKVENGVYTTSPYGVKSGVYTPYPAWAEQKIVDAQVKAVKNIEPFLVPGITARDVIQLIKEGKKGEAVQAAPTIGQERIDLASAVKNGRTPELLTLGIDKVAIAQAAEYNREVAEYERLTGKKWSDIKKEYEPKMARELMARDARLQYETAQIVSKMAVYMIPVVGRAIQISDAYKDRHFSKGEIASIAIDTALDVTLLFGGVGVMAKAARMSLVASRAVRLRLAAKAGMEYAFNVMVAPVESALHPVATAKGAYKGGRALVEYVVDRRRLTEAAVSTARGVVNLKVPKGVSQAEVEAAFKQARDELGALAQAGKRPVVQVNGIEIELARSPLMKELGGGLAHATPDIRELEGGLTVKAKPGMPEKEQGWFLSVEPAPRFAERSAFGKESIPVPKGASGKVLDVADYRVDDLVRLDKAPVRKLDFADANDIPPELAGRLQAYATREKAVVYGSFNEWIKVSKAAKPNDVDLVFQNPNKAIRDIVEIARQSGYEAKAVRHGVAIKYNGEWVKLGDIASPAQHEKMLNFPMITNEVDGIRVETLGKQFIGQAYGAVAGDEKAITRAAKLERTANDVRKMLRESGVGKMKPGIYITGPELKTAPTGKLYHGGVEMERKVVVGGEVPAPKQKITFRTAGEYKKVEVWLPKKLSAAQLAKLKVVGLFEEPRSIFRPAISIRGLSKDGNLTAKEISTLARVIDEGENAEVARRLSRNVSTITTTGAIPRVSGALLTTEAEPVTAPAAGEIVTTERVTAPEPTRVEPLAGRAISTQEARAMVRGETIQSQRVQSTQDARKLATLARQEAEAKRTIEEARSVEETTRVQETRIDAEISRDRAQRELQRITSERAKLRQEIARRPAETYRPPAPATRVPEQPRIETPPRVRVPERLRGTPPPRVRVPERLRGTPPPRIEIPPRVPPPVPRVPPPPRTPPPIPRIPPPPRTPPPVPRVPPPPRTPPPPPRVSPPDKSRRTPLVSAASEKAKRELIRRTPGAVTYNMGKLQRRGGLKDIWWTKLPDRPEAIMTEGDAPEGARILADGPGSAYETTQTIGQRQPFQPFVKKHGAVDITVRPDITTQGAKAFFRPIFRAKPPPRPRRPAYGTPKPPKPRRSRGAGASSLYSGPNVRYGNGYARRTKGGFLVLSRRPIGGRRRRR